MSKKNKAEALKLISEGMDLQSVAHETGYTLRSIYGFKKELNEKKEVSNNTENGQPLNTYIEETLQKALDTLLQHLEKEASIDIVEGIVKITETIDRMNNPNKHFAGIISNEDSINTQGTGTRQENNGWENVTTTSADAHNFVDILERTSRSTDETD